MNHEDHPAVEGSDPVAGEQERRRGVWGALRTAMLTAPAIIGSSIIGLFLVLSVPSQYLKPYSTSQPSCAVFEAPSPQHWLGCDDGGIDMLSLVLQGGQISMFVGFTAAVIAIDRLLLGAELNEPDISTFYASGPAGYIDYPTLDELEDARTA